MEIDMATRTNTRRAPGALFSLSLPDIVAIVFVALPFLVALALSLVGEEVAL